MSRSFNLVLTCWQWHHTTVCRGNCSDLIMRWAAGAVGNVVTSTPLGRDSDVKKLARNFGHAYKTFVMTISGFSTTGSCCRRFAVLHVNKRWESLPVFCLPHQMFELTMSERIWRSAHGILSWCGTFFVFSGCHWFNYWQETQHWCGDDT